MLEPEGLGLNSGPACSNWVNLIVLHLGFLSGKMILTVVLVSEGC